MHKYMEQIQQTGINPDLIKSMIEEHKPDRNRMMNLYDRYRAEIGGVPILSRKPVEYEDFETGSVKRIDNKVNNKINNAFDAEIVDTKIGYMFGHAITYEIDADKDGELDKETKLQKETHAFNMRNNVEDEDSEWGKKAAICGYGSRLAYVDKNGDERIRNVNPWETIFISDRSIAEPTYALRYYPIDKDDGRQIYQADFYNESHRITFKQSSPGGAFVENESKEHLFEYCPLFGLPNNDELKGDAEKVINLVDAYDRALSDANNEVEQYRLAYLVMRGAVADDEALEEINRKGIFELLDDKESVSYLTKDINDTMIENHLNRLEENILRFAKSVNFGDEQFGTSISGVAMKYKLMSLENKCITMERKMTTALRYQFKVLCSAWAKRNKCKEDDYLNYSFQFKRNLPVNLREEAETQTYLSGTISERTRLGLLSFIDDVQEEEQRIEAEKPDMVNLDDEIDDDDE
ncbi:phage portal protein [Virgibacillus oceani]